MKIPERILIVEDTDVDRALAVRVFRRAWPDTAILEARDGEEAIEVLERCGAEMPDIIFLDVNMPKMNGHGFLEAWYANSGIEIPVVMMLTSSNQPIDRDRAGRFPSVRNYIVKPITKAAVTRLPELAGCAAGSRRARPT